MAKVTKKPISLKEKLGALELSTGITGRKVLASNRPHEAQAALGVGRRNIIINGDMRIAQRYVTNSRGGGADFACDRFLCNSPYANFTVSRENGGPSGFSNYLKYQADGDSTLGSNHDPWIRYTVEADDMKCLDWDNSDTPKMAVISFWASASIAGQYSFAITSGNFSATQVIYPYTITKENEWQKFEFKIRGPRNTAMISGDFGLRLYWAMGAGSNYTIGNVNVGQWLTSGNFAVDGSVQIHGRSGQHFSLTGVQMEVGEVATPFEHKPIGEELALCQRYFYKLTESYQGDITLQTALAPNTDHGISMIAVWDNTNCYGVVHHPVSMRTSPSISQKPGISEANSFKLYSAGLSQNTADYKQMGSSELRSELVWEYSGSFTIGNSGWVRLQNDSELWFDAEF